VTSMALLHAVCHPGQVTAAEALAWITTGRPSTTASSEPVIGYLLASDRAEWFRCEAAAPHGPGGPRDLGGVFEVFATDGATQLRWVHQASGVGRAVGLAEDTAALPPGEAVAMSPERHRLDGTSQRLLAGQVTSAGEGWARLVTARYAPCDVPVYADRDQQIWAEQAEYVASDEHGNLSVADTLLLRLVARPALPATRGQP